MPDSPMRRNYPDGSLQDPLFWIGNDKATNPDWAAYGAGPNYINTGNVLPAVTRATQLVVTPVIRTQWGFFKQVGEMTPTDVHATDERVPRPLWVSDPQLLGRIPGGEMGRATVPRARRLGGHSFWRTLLTHAVWWGTGALLYTIDFQGRPLAGTLRIVNPDRWGYTEDGRYVLYGDGTEDPLESDFDGAFHVGATEWRMATILGFPPNDGVVSGGALSRSGLLLSTGTNVNSYLNGLLSNSGVPSGVLRVAVPNYSAPQAEQLKAQWMEAHGGVSRSVAVLSSGIDYAPLQLNVVDSDAVNLQGALLTQVAHAFGISAGLLDSAAGGGSITYASLSDRRRDHLDHSLADLGRSMEDLISSLLPWGTSMLIDWKTYTSTNPVEMVSYTTAGVTQGWMTKAEVRNLYNLTPVEMPEEEDVAPQPPQLEGGDDDAADDE